MLSNPIMFNWWCSVCVQHLQPRVRVHFVAAALPVGRLLHRFCSCNGAVRCACCAFAAGARLTALTVAAARPRLSLPLSGGPKFTAPQHLCRCHGVVRLPQLRAELPCGRLVFYSHKHQVANTTRSRSIARAHFVMWTTSECVEGCWCDVSSNPVARSKVSLCIIVHHRQRGQSSSFVFVHC